MGINAVFEALAHPARRKILRLLRGGPLSAGELASHFALTKPDPLGPFQQAQAGRTGHRRTARHQSDLSPQPSVLEEAVGSLLALKDRDHDS